MNAPAELAIEARNLTKKYEDFTAVDGLNLSIERGEVFGLLGPNGAGKTTIILMLLGLTEPTSGSCRIFGYDPVKQPLKVKRLIGYLPETIGFYENMTARQNLKFFARLNNIREEESDKLIHEALHTVGLGDYAGTRVSKFSRGMKQRLGMANVLFKKPKLAFLDEPTQGIDPRGVYQILELLSQMKKEEGITIMISSHLIHHVQQICDRVGIMVEGRMAARGAVEELDWDKGQSWVIEVEARGLSDGTIKDVLGIQGVKDVDLSGEILTVECDVDLRSEISEAVIRGGSSLLGLRVKERSLDEIYRRYSEGR